MNAVHRLVRNSTLLLASTLVARGASAILFIVAARRISPENVGIYSLAITYSVIILGITSWGLDQILIRDVARAPSDAGRYLAGFSVLRLGLATLVYVSLWLGLGLLRPYGDRTIQTVLIVGMSTIPDSLNDICQAIFIARERLFVPSMASISLALVRIGLGTTILLVRPDLIWLAWVFPITSLASMIVSLGLVLASGVRPVLRFDRRWLKQMLIAGVPLAAINSLLVFEVQAGVILLSLLISETAVGLFGAANAIFTALSMLPYAWQASIFPLMSRLYARTDGTFEQLYEKLYLYLTIGAIALIVSVMAFADVLITQLYGTNFERSIGVLRVLIAVLFFSFLNIPNSRLMIILNKQNVLALFLTVSVTVNLVLSWLLIPRLGVAAVAVTRLCSSGLFFLMNYLFVHRRIRQVGLLRLIWKPLAAGIGAMGILLAFRSVGPLWRTLIALFSYGVLLWVCRAIPREDVSLVFQRYRGSV